MFSLVSSWASTLSLVFGGCCANALTLEQLTLTYHNFGTLITFLQFALIALHGIPNHVQWTRYGPRFKPHRIPLLPYFGQVSLFYLLSMLNNAAFAYRIPMAVHIIFRSGGLVVSMILGVLIGKKRYNAMQVSAVVLVTAGVVLTTLSASKPKSSTASANSNSSPYEYATGIGLMSIALVLGGLLGQLQDWTFRTYGRPTMNAAQATPTPSTPTKGKGKGKGKAKLTNGKSAAAPAPAPAGNTWSESMFFLHLLGLPMFLPMWGDLKRQLHTINYNTPRHLVPLAIPSSLSAFLGTSPQIPPPHTLPSLLPENSFLYPKGRGELVLSLPKPYFPLLLNTLTQLLCVAGVNRLTARVSALTVTLILVVRKAVSLVISLKGRALVAWVSSHLPSLPVGGGGGSNPLVRKAGELFSMLMGFDVAPLKTKQPAQVDETMLWSGAGLVLLGTIAYSIGTGWSKKAAAKEKKE